MSRVPGSAAAPRAGFSDMKTHVMFLVFLNVLSVSRVDAWTEIHPFILYGREDVPEISERLGRDPYKSWFEQETGEADAILALDVSWDSASVPPETRAYYAKVLSFAFAFTDSSAAHRTDWAREAALSLYHLPPDDYGSHFSSDLAVSEAALFWAEAYDILKGAEFDFEIDGYGNVEPAIRERLGSLRAYMGRDYYSPFSPVPAIGTDFPSAAYYTEKKVDNHHVKLYSSLAVLALAVLDEDGSSGDFEHAFLRLPVVLNTMTVTGDDGEPAGGWAEGPNYHLYSGHQYYTAVSALKRAGIADLFSDYPELTATDLLLPAMVMPDGCMPPFDDNEAVVFHLAGLLYSYHDSLPERDMLLWMWNLGGRKVEKAFRADYIALFDDTPPVYSDPEGFGWSPTGFFPESGFARFRSSWEDDSVYLLLLSEHGESRENGQAHEHPDPNSVILHAFGEMLLLDSGYGGWSEHDKTRFAENHNIVLVNGEGPEGASQDGFFNFWYANGSDARLTEHFTARNLDYAASETTYRGTRFIRRVIFPERRFFLLFDTLESGFEATYTLLLHGNGGGSSGGEFTLMDGGAEWRREGAVLRSLTVGSSPPLLFETENMYHAVYARSPMKDHTVLKISQTGNPGKFLSLLFPYPEGAGVPEAGEIPVSGGAGIRLARTDTVTYCLLRSSDDVIDLRSGDFEISARSDFLYCTMTPDGAFRDIFFLRGTSVEDAGGPIVVTSREADLYADYSEPDEIAGYIRTEEETSVTFYDVQASGLVYRGGSIPFDTTGGGVTATFWGEGDFRILRGGSTVTIHPPEDLEVRDVPDDNGHALQLVWTLSRSEEDGIVLGYRIYRSRSDTFSEPVPLSGFASTDSLNSWEERHTVLIDSVGAGVSEYIDECVPLNGVSYHYWVEAFGAAGTSEKTGSGTAVSVDAPPPGGFHLSRPFPNPFNASVTLSYEIPEDCTVELTVHDVLGKRVKVLVDGHAAPGTYETVWDGTDENGTPVGSGVFLVRLGAGGLSMVRRVVLMR